MIFGIGLSKTGTHSLTDALKILGFSAIHLPYPLNQIEGYDAATDVTVANHFQELDKEYPNSKFILTIREKDDWIESCKLHFSNIVTGDLRLIRKETYGMARFRSDVWLKVYDNHIQKVKDYFGENNNLLELNICGGGGWEKLCPFLGKEIPNIPFPWSGRRR